MCVQKRLCVKRVWNFFFFCFFSVLGFFGSAVVSVFPAIWSILELEAAISTVLQHFGVRTSHFPYYLQHVGALIFMLDCILRLGSI
jgi:hypothetical protein